MAKFDLGMGQKPFKSYKSTSQSQLFWDEDPQISAIAGGLAAYQGSDSELLLFDQA